MTRRGDPRSPQWRAPREEGPGSIPGYVTQPTAKKTSRFVNLFVRHNTSTGSVSRPGPNVTERPPYPSARAGSKCGEPRPAPVG